ncbi:MAG TPA: hypothetical protein PK079_22795 [Leptospiraceae bacterium]|nr:hypothetical protein [Leptospiraceae bacterium]HMW08437.1 hypothetical protein [Leptospiraceae bacterium]HMY34264.1 hypothetical protein [Leptospiraceae bacterium]HMZ67239.1 hypothetical protein [Leptospiraceae bacterium]HNA10011.1 hypothetical protein [Leptospiraceae bacterium]
MQQVFGLLLGMLFLVFISFVLSVGLISVLSYSYFYFKYKSWKYYKRCMLFTFLGGCLGVFITFVLIPKTQEGQILPYSILFLSMFLSGFASVAVKKFET